FSRTGRRRIRRHRHRRVSLSDGPASGQTGHLRRVPMVRSVASPPFQFPESFDITTRAPGSECSVVALHGAAIDETQRETMTDDARGASRRRRRKGAGTAPVEGRAAAREPAAAPADKAVRWPRVALGVILAAAAIFRIAYFLQCRAVSIFSDAPMLDAFI